MTKRIVRGASKKKWSRVREVTSLIMHVGFWCRLRGRRRRGATIDSLASRRRRSPPPPPTVVVLTPTLTAARRLPSPLPQSQLPLGGETGRHPQFRPAGRISVGAPCSSRRKLDLFPILSNNRRGPFNGEHTRLVLMGVR